MVNNQIKKKWRMVVISNYFWLTISYHQSQYLAEKYESAKSSISEDIVIIKRAFEEIGNRGHIQTVTGARWCYFYTIDLYPLSPKQSKSYDKLLREWPYLPGGYIYLSDLLSTPAILKNIGRIIAKSFMDQKIDAVMTVATKGVPLANAVVKISRDCLSLFVVTLKITEGSTVSVKSVSGSSGPYRKFLSKRSLS